MPAPRREAAANHVQSECEQAMSAVDGDVLLAGHPIRRYRSLTCWTDFDCLRRRPQHRGSVETARGGMPAGRFENRPQALAHHDDGLIYMATDEGIVSAVVAATGQRVWRERIPGVYKASR